MSPAALGAGRRDQGVRPLDPRLPRPVDRRRQLRARTRPTTPRRSPRCSCWPTRSTGCSASAASPAPSTRTRESSSRLYGWAEKSEYATPFVRRPGRAVLRRRHHRLRRVGRRRRDRQDAARQRRRRRRALPQAGPQPAAGRHVPGRRPRRRQRADRLHRPRRRPAVAADRPGPSRPATWCTQSGGEQPGVLAAAALAGVDQQRPLGQRHPGQRRRQRPGGRGRPRRRPAGPRAAARTTPSTTVGTVEKSTGSWATNRCGAAAHLRLQLGQLRGRAVRRRRPTPCPPYPSTGLTTSSCSRSRTSAQSPPRPAPRWARWPAAAPRPGRTGSSPARTR